MDKSNQGFYLSKQEPVRSCLEALRLLILGYDETMNETTKYGMPCFCLGDKIFCYLWTNKDSGQPYLLMKDGGRMQHTSLVQDGRKRMKTLPIDAQSDIPLEVIHSVFDEAKKLIG